MSNRYSGTLREISEFDSLGMDVGLAWTPRSGNRLSLSYRDTDGQNINRPRTAGSTRDYRQRELRLTALWMLTGATRMSGYLGQTRRSYDLAPERDFSGLTGRITFDWAPTDKMSIAATIRREIGAEQDLIATFAVTEAFSVKPVWRVTEKITLEGMYERLRRDLRGDTGAVPTELVAGRGTVRSQYGLSLSYQPIDALVLGVEYRRRQRSTDNRLRDYSVDSASVSARFAF